MPDNTVVVVVRCAGERTITACLDILTAQLPPKNINVVNERPFEAALKKTYEIGISRNAKWTMTLDADVLIRAGAVDEFVAQAEQMPEHYVQIEGRIFDKIMGTYRQAGHRIYRTSLLHRALDLIPRTGSQIRPEYATLNALGSLGHPSRRVPCIFGVHDFHQSYSDLYRKAYIHAKKHDYLAAHLIARCLKNEESDADFRIILKAFLDGLKSELNVSISAELLKEQALAAITKLGLSEKPAISIEELGSLPDWIENTLKTEKAPDMDIIDEPHGSASHQTRFARLKEIRGRYGTPRALAFAGGSILEKIGGMVKRIAPL